MHFDVLLSQPRRAVRGVQDGRERAVQKREPDGEALRCRCRCRPSGRDDQRASDAPGHVSDEPAGNIDEVASLTKEPPATLTQIVRPVIGRKRSRIDAVQDLKRLSPFRRSSRSSIPSGAYRRLKPTASICPDVSRADRSASSSSVVSAGGFSTNTVLPAESARGERCMRVVAGGDDNRSDGGVGQHIVDRSGAGETEPLRCGFGAETVSRSRSPRAESRPPCTQESALALRNFRRRRSPRR